MATPPEAYLSFEPQFLIGIEIVDSQHRQIVDVVNELYASVISNKREKLPLGLLTRLVGLAKAHFDTEEQLLLAHACPGYLRHKAAHDGLAHNLIEYRDRIARREGVLTVEYMELIKLWLIDHIAEFDIPYSRFLAGDNLAAERDSPGQPAASPHPTPP